MCSNTGALLALISCSLTLDLATADQVPQGDALPDEVRERLQQMGVEVDGTARSPSEEGPRHTASTPICAASPACPRPRAPAGEAEEREVEEGGRRRSGSRSASPRSPSPPAPSLASCLLAPAP